MQRYAAFGASLALTLLSALALIWSAWFWLPLLVFAGISAFGIYDVTQRSHSILRNYPVIGHMRFIFEGIRPEIRQYLIESDQDEEPFSRDERSLIYQRAKGAEDKRPFGTRQRVYDSGYQWLTHSVVAKHLEDHDFRTVIGGPDCQQPYRASLYNISAMSFGALSGNAILALNKGAKMGGFAHDTGEGGGDLIYQVGSGYFGCRTAEGRFDPEAFAKQAADPQVKLIELKLSQGAKPGHGGVLPARKISEEIAEARGVPTARAVGRQTGGYEDVHRAPAGIHVYRQGDAGDRYRARFHRDRRQGGRHGSGAVGIRQSHGHAAGRGADLRA